MRVGRLGRMWGWSAGSDGPVWVPEAARGGAGVGYVERGSGPERAHYAMRRCGARSNVRGGGVEAGRLLTGGVRGAHVGPGGCFVPPRVGAWVRGADVGARTARPGTWCGAETRAPGSEESETRARLV